jgi:hypothetical protein
MTRPNCNVDLNINALPYMRWANEYERAKQSGYKVLGVITTSKQKEGTRQTR